MAAARNTADVLIIGSGGSAGPFAWSLSQVPGITIACLEQGDWDDPAKRRPVATPRPSSPPATPGVRSFADGYPYDFNRSYWQPVLGNHVGGAMVHYAGIWHRLNPSDFLTRSLTGVGEDWPITYWDLEPFYEANDEVVGVSGVPGDPMSPPRRVPLQPVVAGPNKAAALLGRGFKKLGYHHWPTELAVLTRPFDGRRARTERDYPADAKNRPDIVHWPKAMERGATMLTRSRVREIVVNKQGVATGALYYDDNGRLQEFKAAVVVLACNGIGTPRLLLNSRSQKFPKGLANRSGQVGKNLMGHPLAYVEAVFEDSDRAPAVGTGVGLYSKQFYETDLNRGFANGWVWYSGGASGPVSAALGWSPASQATEIPDHLQAVSLGAGRAIPWGRAHRAAFQERYRRTVTLLVQCHELPEEANRVELHPTLTDDAGIPAPSIAYRRGANTEKILAFGVARTVEVLEAAGAAKIVSTERRDAAPGHYLGTARMGADPERSVVDRWCRAHDVPNLFIIDGSIFASSGAVTPTATIQALALRAADYLKRHSRDILRR